ncbi:MAG: hypothetical protein Q8P68_00140 [Candidatus Peregrinibacteria bacterium]|nr:hypothetical protein [Candidatus Peregrinibacteria bacterium]MDZ4244618.1 hypothetical protein [Candidatus Gracilibacteria bacterium]
MNNLDLLPLISIPVLYFIVALLKPYIRLPFNICAICISVNLTWIALLTMWFYGFEVSIVTIGILMGMSITGIMYKSEDLYKEKKIRNFWFVRLVIIIGGFYGIYLLFEQNWDSLIFLLFVMLFSILIPTVFFQKITHEEVVNSNKEVKKSLLEKLDDCC